MGAVVAAGRRSGSSAGKSKGTDQLSVSADHDVFRHAVLVGDHRNLAGLSDICAGRISCYGSDVANDLEMAVPAGWDVGAQFGRVFTERIAGCSDCDGHLLHSSIKHADLRRH